MEKSPEEITLRLSSDMSRKLQELQEDRQVSIPRIIAQAIGTEYFLFDKLRSGNKILLQEGNTLTELRFKNYRGEKK